MSTDLKVGIDIGSTTIKVVVLDALGKLIYSKYARHFSDIPNALTENLKALKEVVRRESFRFAMTGSAGMGIAQRLGLPFVQEVIAAATAVKRLIPQTDTMVELGGEDAKIMYFGAAPEERMNGVCAGGTGAFIDHMSSLLHTDAKGLNDLAARGQRIYTIASRCGVFAKTDIQALMNDGVSKEDIAISILQAVVNQTIGNLAQGREISGNVAFLGGPLFFLPELKKRFIETLKLTEDHVVPVENGAYFVAMGVAMADEAEEMDFAALTANLDKAAGAGGVSENTNPPLFGDKEEYDAFLRRHDRDKVARGDFASYEGPVYIGIDAGSTTTKIVAIGKDRELLYTDYGSNQGSPLKVVVRELQGLYAAMPDTAYVAGTLTTGYGENIVRAAIHADSGEVETFAHYRAASEFCPQVSCVLDIGGQDMKCFLIKDGNITQITLNEACSAGCGSFIENFAQGLGLTAEEFAKEAVKSAAPVDLGTRCTVFMNSRVKQAQKEGASLPDISAGIALSIIKNALFKVMQLKDVAELGDHIVVQGGTFYNDAVLRNMELLLKKDVIRPDISGLMGAYGAAILAMEQVEDVPEARSAVLGPEELRDFTVTSTSYRCQGCGNHCLVTMQKFPDGGKYFTGNRCKRGEGKTREKRLAPNIYAYKYQRLFEHYEPLKNAPRGRIGIPRVLNMYEDYPFWATFFTRLGYEVVLSGKSSAQMYYKGMATVPSDSLCYPAKLVHGHVMDLVQKGLKKIFYPCLPYNMEDPVNPSGNHYNCPVVASYAENIRANMDVLEREDVEFLQPFLPINTPERMEERLREALAGESIPAGELRDALKAAYDELERYREDVRRKGAEIIETAREKNLPIILLVGRPYHVDPEINHGIPDMIQSYNLAIVSEDSVYHMDAPEEKLDIVNQWSYHSRLYHAASFAASQPDITLMQLSSFGCGLDAITINQVKDIIEGHHRLYTMIKLDEVSNLGAARIRLRSLLAVLARRTVPEYEALEIPERAYFEPDCKKTHTILAPQMAPIHFELISHALKKYGYNVVVPSVGKQEGINTGLRYVHNDMCYPAIVVIGQLLEAVRSGKVDPDHTSVMLFQTCGACRATNYLNLARRAFRDAGYPQIPIFACWGMEQDSFDLKLKGFKDVAKAILYGDLLMNVTNRMRPYELVAGATDALFTKWMRRCKEELRNGGFRAFRKTVRNLVREFDAIPLVPDLWKPRVGVVGEILVKYHPVANNRLENVLAKEGAEVIMPDLASFLLYMAFDGISRHDILDGSLLQKLGGKLFIQLVEFMRSPIKKALEASSHFTPPESIYEIARAASRHVSLGNMAGEGWLLTGEMASLMEKGIRNVVCLQPWACLPNHIMGKGMFREIRRWYEDANLVAMDCDAGASEVNQLNRLKLMLSVARDKCPEGKILGTQEHVEAVPVGVPAGGHA